jgi:hypothetical protein
MAKNYTLKEAANIIAEGKKKDEIVDIGRRFPLLAVSLTAVIAQAKDNFLDFINYMPDHITANKINSAMKADIEETEEDSEVEEEAPKKAEKSAKKAPAKKAKEDEAEASDYDSISGTKLYEMIKEAGKLKDLKAKGFGTKKADLIAYLKDNPLDGVKEEEEAGEDGSYESMTAMELFKECKNRGIKAAPKKPAKFYIDLLKKDDASKAEDTDAEDEDWDDEEPEEKPTKKPVKSEKKAEKKAEKKPAKKAEPEPEEDDDDGDDWDI